MKVLCDLTVTRNQPLGGALWAATLEIPPAAGAVLPEVKAGRFAMLRCGAEDALDFRRPFSFAQLSEQAGSFSILYRVVGERTEWLSRAKPGQQLSALLPLGNAFSPPRDGSPVLLVGGGVGVAPLLLLAQELAAAGYKPVPLYFGAATASELALEFVRAFPVELHAATDDRTYGYPGTVVANLLADGLPEGAQLYACGPRPMLEALRAALPPRTPVQASLEEVMACGIGACYGCAVMTDGLGAEAMKLVCRDGPVFDLWRLCPC